MLLKHEFGLTLNTHVLTVTVLKLKTEVDILD